VETELDLGDHSAKFGVERDPVQCGHLNGDVCNLCGWKNFGNKSCVSCSCFDFIIVLVQVCSCLELALTLGVIPSK
jgi:hypothetical protein